MEEAFDIRTLPLADGVRRATCLAGRVDDRLSAGASAGGAGSGSVFTMWGLNSEG
jgi:hypothetical protein